LAAAMATSSGGLTSTAVMKSRLRGFMTGCRAIARGLAIASAILSPVRPSSLQAVCPMGHNRPPANPGQQEETGMDDVRWLRDVEEIKMAKARYGDIVDHLPETGKPGVDELCKLFTPDAVLDFSAMFGKVLEGHSGIHDQFDFLAENRAWMWHIFSNPIVEVDGDTAKAQWLLYAMSTGRDNPEAPPRLSYGRYYDEYVRTSDGWKQSRLRVTNETHNWSYLPNQPK
jgi:hypothetical protein